MEVMEKFIFNFLLCLSISTLFGCGRDQNGTPINGLGEPPVQEKPGESEPPLKRVPQICSALDFNGVTWPKGYSEMDKIAFALAMNISGSFEGHSGWTNLSNNFDGQGFSMGILNQNLGQGSIQPMLIIMRDQHMDVLKKYLKTDMLNSMLKMLADWEKANPQVPAFQPLQLTTFEREPVLFSDENIDKKYGVNGIQLRSNKASVRWASRTLYTDSKGRNFKPEWKKGLKDIAGDPAYVSLQIAAAQELHDQGRGDQARANWEQIRSYLFLFDVVVQNGGLKDKHFNKYERWLKNNKNSTEEQQMLEMLEIRVVDSKKQWQKDVRLRKTAVIKGVGFVHGEDRDLQTEYCYDQTIPY